MASILLPATPSARADVGLLKEAIIGYNMAQQKRSLSRGTYRGEAGLLRIGPHVGRSMGLQVYIDRNYIEAEKLFDQADEAFRDALKAMAAFADKDQSEEYVRRIRDRALIYRKALHHAQSRMKIYGSALGPEVDERLNDTICSEVLERLLGESIKQASNNLRDALADFYNRCREGPAGGPPLNEKNVAFVNHVFLKFAKTSSPEARGRFDLDRIAEPARRGKAQGWKWVVERACYPYLPHFDAVFKGSRGRYPVDSLLFLALIKQESNFNAKDVSQVGAAGLTQIMPRTAIDLGMQRIFKPPYLQKAKSLLERERSSRQKAVALIKGFSGQDGLKMARRSRKLMQRSLLYRRQRISLFARYKRELLKNGTDDRLNPRKAIKYGFQYFSRMMEIQKGDISLALASYNAGPHRVRQYMGIPPFAETVTFRNRVLGYYRDYLRGLKRKRADTRAVPSEEDAFDALHRTGSLQEGRKAVKLRF